MLVFLRVFIFALFFLCPLDVRYAQSYSYIRRISKCSVMVGDEVGGGELAASRSCNVSLIARQHAT